MTITEPQPAPASQAPAEPQYAPGDREMTMLEHLTELRQRLVMIVLSIVIGLVVALIPWPVFGPLTEFVVQRLVERAPGGTVIGIRPGEAFFTYLQVAVMLGVSLAMPAIIYQVLAFVAPALYPREKKYLYLAIPGISLSFLAGVVFCYSFMLPFAINFLGGFATHLIQPQWTAEHYLDFVTGFLFWVGLVFELPLAMFFLTKLGVVQPQRLASFRKYAFLLSFILAALITTTPDPINQSIVALPIYLLYELGVLLSRIA